MYYTVKGKVVCPLSLHWRRKLDGQVREYGTIRGS